MKTHLGHYEIVGELGRGGMGVVYKGYEPALGRYVAIKELSPSLAHDPNLVERFLREARSMAALNDPHIIQIYFIGTDEASGQPFFAMEFVDGDSLSGLLKREGKLSVENALKVLHQTAQGLATAHDKGVVHRDIKPGNLMITTRGNVKIADFGIALATQDFSKKLTSTGEFVGTPGYLSPEVCTGKTVDQRSDIFSLGIVMFEMLSGASPFTDESPLGLMLEVVKAEIPDIRALNGEVDLETAAILARMVAKEPADRFQSCHELATVLQAHPLVAKGGTIQLPVARPEPAAATVVGAPTPGSQPLSRPATPPPVVGRAVTPAAAAVAVDAPTAASAAPIQAAPVPQPRRSGAAVPLAIAAAVLLLVGGSAYALRDSLGSIIRTGSATVVPVTTAAEPAPAGADVAVASAPAPASPAPTPVMPDGAGNDMAAAAADPITAGVEVEPVAVIAAVAADDASAVPAAVPSAPVVAAVAAPAVPVAMASAPPPKPRDVSPPRLRIAVVALGDPALATPVRQLIEGRLSRAGFELVESSLFVGGRADLADAMRALRGEATVIVAVQTEGLGQRQLQYYGRSDTQYSANLSVRAYQVGDRRPLGPGFVERVDFTTLNANTQAESAVDPHLDTIVGELRPLRARG
jgi:eukaryotic-like serine/threonine-protein kinase